MCYFSGHMEWHVGRYSVVVKYHMEDWHQQVCQHFWRMAGDWKHLTMQLAQLKCMYNNNWLLLYYSGYYLIQLYCSDATVLAWRPWPEANILSVTDSDWCHSFYSGWICWLPRDRSLWWISHGIMTMCVRDLYLHAQTISTDEQLITFDHSKLNS